MAGIMCAFGKIVIGDFLSSEFNVQVFGLRAIILVLQVISIMIWGIWQMLIDWIRYLNLQKIKGYILNFALRTMESITVWISVVIIFLSKIHMLLYTGGHAPPIEIALMKPTILQQWSFSKED